MSKVVVHLDRTALLHARLRWEERRRHRIDPHTNEAAAAALYDRINKLQVREIEALAKAAMAEREVETARARARERQLRERATRGLLKAPPTPSKALATVSPRKDPLSRFAVADCSQELQAMEASATAARAGSIPRYLHRRLAEQRAAAVKREQEDYRRQLTARMPAEREPLDPALAERTKARLERLVAELEARIAGTSFASRESVTGRMRLAALEEELRAAEDARRRFSFPVVFVEHHEPRSICAQPKPIGAHSRPRSARGR